MILCSFLLSQNPGGSVNSNKHGAFLAVFLHTIPSSEYPVFKKMYGVYFEEGGMCASSQ